MVVTGREEKHQFKGPFAVFHSGAVSVACEEEDAERHTQCLRQSLQHLMGRQQWWYGLTTLMLPHMTLDSIFPTAKAAHWASHYCLKSPLRGPSKDELDISCLCKSHCFNSDWGEFQPPRTESSTFWVSAKLGNNIETFSEADVGCRPLPSRKRRVTMGRRSLTRRWHTEDNAFSCWATTSLIHLHLNIITGPV